MEIKKEIKDKIRANREAILYIYRDAIITYIKLILIFPKQPSERNLFIKQLFKFKDILIEEIKFLEYLIKISKSANEEKIYEILDILDFAFEQEYLYYDDIVSYMEKSIDNNQLNFSNVSSKESIILTKIKLYKSELLVK